MQKILLVIAMSIVGVAIVYADDNTLMTSGIKSQHGRHHRASHIQKSAITGVVNINTASLQDIATLKGIGEKKAAAIVAYRDENGLFTSVHDLMYVKGIGKAALARLEANNHGRIITE